MKKILLTAAVISGVLAAGGTGITMNYNSTPDYVSAADITEFNDEAAAVEFIETILTSQEHMPQKIYDEFKSTYGSVSVHGSYIVFCTSESWSINYFTEQSGTANVDDKIPFQVTDTPVPTGSSYDGMYIFKATNPGELKFEILSAPYKPGAVKTPLYSAELTVDEELTLHIVSEDTDPDSPISGDINSDGIIDITDLSEFSLSLIGESTLTERQMMSADVDKNGKSDLADLARIKQYISMVIPYL